MTGKSSFTDPCVCVEQLDTAPHRAAILRAIRRAKPLLEGRLLDLGCGRMPYRELLLSPPAGVTEYVGVDVPSSDYGLWPQVAWDGKTLPFREESFACAICTEVLEHCPDPAAVLRETCRVLKPDGLLFLTVPFLWPLHNVPHDEYRYTPYSLRRLLESAGFEKISLGALGGWDAALAQMIGLWVRRRRMPRAVRAVLSFLALPVVRLLLRCDWCPDVWADDLMITGLHGTARKPAAAIDGTLSGVAGS